MTVSENLEKVSNAAVEMRGIRIQFGDFVANDAVDLSVAPGEIHALLGENGAGKSTLMNALSGLIQPDTGQIFIHGNKTRINGAQNAQKLGIGMVHQHFMLINTMTVADNVVLGLPPERSGGRRIFPNMVPVHKAIQELGKSYGLAVDPKAKVSDLSVAGQQRVEILKVLYRGARILILDEPTAVLTPQETQQLFIMLRALAKAGHAIIFISHKLHEVKSITDQITILRKGLVVGTYKTSEMDERAIAHLMVGSDVRKVQATEQAQSFENRPTYLSVSNVSLNDERGLKVIDDVSMTVASGQIVGVAGVDGNGQFELAEAIVGLRNVRHGRIDLVGQDVTHVGPEGRIRCGLAHIPADRHKYAILEDMSVQDNAVIETCGKPEFSRFGMLKKRAMAMFTEKLVAQYDVRLSEINQPIRDLSGGNQQKLVLGRGLSRLPKVIVAVQPTRGLDLGATAFLQRSLLDARARGAGIVLVSTELDELLGICDRIFVMFQGKAIGSLERSNFSKETLGLMMTGQEI